VPQDIGDTEHPDGANNSRYDRYPENNTPAIEIKKTTLTVSLYDILDVN
jgi:hypothetical protein